MSIQTSAKRIAEDGATEIIIMDGAVFVVIYRQGILIEERIYNAADLLELDIDRLLIDSSTPQQLRKRAATVVT